MVLLVFDKTFFVVLEQDEVSKGDYLLRKLKEAGILFEPSIPNNKVSNALKNFLLPKLQAVNKAITIETRAGWTEGGKFQHSSNFYIASSLPEKVPVDTCDFPALAPSGESLDCLIRMLRAFSPLLRFLLLLTLVTGLFHSRLTRAGMKIRHHLNLILGDDFEIDLLVRLLRVFNRNNLTVTDASIAPTQFQTQLRAAKDDVLLIYAVNQEDASDNRKKNKANNLGYLTQSIRLGELEAGAVTISDSLQSGNVINLILPDYDTIDPRVVSEFVRDQSVDKFLCGMVDWAESHPDEVSRCLRRKYDLQDRRLIPMAAAEALLVEFFRAWNIDIREAAALPPITELSEVFADWGEEPEAQLALFRRVVREGCKAVYAYPKKYNSSFLEDCFYYDTEYVYFPQKLLRNILREGHAENTLDLALVHLRNDGDLKTNNASAKTRKTQFGNHREPVYCIRRSFFCRQGEADVVALAKGDDADV